MGSLFAIIVQRSSHFVNSPGVGPGKFFSGGGGVERAYCCIDLKSFYASVECVARGLDPLTARLVVADEERTDKTICLAVTPALKALGVPGRSRLFEVYECLKNVRDADTDFIIARPRMGLYLDVSARVYSIYLRHISPEDIHIYSVDEVFIDLTLYLRPARMTAREFTAMLVREVLEETGITATAGIGTNMYLAKIAMDIMAKKARPGPGGERIAELDEASYRRLLWDHRPLTDFWQIGPGISRRLGALGVATMGELARLSARDEGALYRAFGVNAELLIDHAWGVESCTMADIKSYEPSELSVSTGQVLSRPYDFEEGRVVISEMAEELTMELTDKGYLTDGIVLHAGYDRDNAAWDGPVKRDHYGRTVPVSAHGSVRLGAPTDALSKITRAVLEAYDREVNKQLLVRRLNIAAVHLRPADSVPRQLSFFADIRAEQREEDLQRAVYALRKKYGKNAILKGRDFLRGATARDRNGQTGGHRL